MDIELIDVNPYAKWEHSQGKQRQLLDTRAFDWPRSVTSPRRPTRTWTGADLSRASLPGNIGSE